MKPSNFKEYLYLGITGLCVIAISVAFAFFLMHFSLITNALDTLIDILSPIIYGAVLAYLLLPVYNFLLSQFCQKTKRFIKNPQRRTGLSKAFATLVSLLVLLAVVAGLFSMIIPQIYENILGLQGSMGSYITNLTQWLSQLLEDNPELAENVMPLYRQGVDKLQSWFTSEAVPNATVLFNKLSVGILNLFNVTKNILIGIIVMIYLLNIKDTLCAQFKRITYSFLSIKAANRLIREIRFIHSVFGGFITGKLLDSLIIGIVCFFVTQLMSMPYSLLVSVIIGITNIIPFFGPFIGAVPSAFLILLVSPVKCLYFLIFIMILQQIDGNILGPRILGNSTGLPSFWVLFSILFMGGLLGFVGMIIAVPTFAVFYRGIAIWSRYALEKKNLPALSGDYRNLDYIDEENRLIPLDNQTGTHTAAAQSAQEQDAQPPVSNRPQ